MLFIFGINIDETIVCLWWVSSKVSYNDTAYKRGESNDNHDNRERW